MLANNVPGETYGPVTERLVLTVLDDLKKVF